MITFSETWNVIRPLAIFVFSIAVYSIFIFKFYRFLARKNIFELDLQKYNKTKHPLLEKTVAAFLYLLEYIMLFPIFTFFWFLILATLLLFMANLPVQTILLISISVVGAVRITAYYSEDLAKDLAKLLPFALLAVILVSATPITLAGTITMFSQVQSQWETIIQYLVFVVLLEFVLRIITSIKKK